MSRLDDILTDTARDIAMAHKDGKPLDVPMAEGAARIAAHFAPKLCATCHEREGGYRGTADCVACYRDRFAEIPDENGEDE